MLGRQTCVDCGRISPENSGEHTLTTSFGWRLRATVNAQGQRIAQWRCEVCWKKFKAQMNATAGETAYPPGSSPRDPRNGE